jgi:hypothetical protein
MGEETLNLCNPVAFANAEEREACIRFFNAAYRAEESGKAQAHALADRVRAWDVDLAECLVLYGDEEGWHRQLLESFMAHIGGEIRPMRALTKAMYDGYGQAKRMDTIVLTNLMFETIGSTTYRIALGRVHDPLVRQMLTILTRDESFHVPLNVHFLKEILRHEPRRRGDRMRRRAVAGAVHMGLVASAYRSRKAAAAFDKIGLTELATAYLSNLACIFESEPELGVRTPRLLLRSFGVSRIDVTNGARESITNEEAAIRAADRSKVEVSALGAPN